MSFQILFHDFPQPVNSFRLGLFLLWLFVEISMDFFIIATYCLSVENGWENDSILIMSFFCSREDDETMMKHILSEIIHIGPEYSQRYNEFIPYMSAIDILFNEGPKSMKIIQNSGVIKRWPNV